MFLFLVGNMTIDGVRSGWEEFRNVVNLSHEVFLMPLIYTKLTESAMFKEQSKNNVIDLVQGFEDIFTKDESVT